MKLLLTKLKISAALDSGKPLPESLRKKIEANPELQHFIRQSQSLETRPPQPPPADAALHNDIMRAIRTSTPKEQAQRPPVFAWLTAAATVAAIVFVSLWLGHPPVMPPDKMAMNAPLAVLEMSEKMPVTMPDAMMAPLTNEWARVSRDVENTGQILAASFPF